MVYVSRDGTVHDKQPWGINKIMSIISGFVNLVVSYFQTMIPIEASPSPNNRFRNSGGFSSGYSSGYSGGPRPPRPGSNIHGLGGLRGSPAPPPACGSCCGM